MITPKEKSRELFEKMYDHQINKTIWTESHDNKEAAKQCALIAVGEIINVLDIVTGFKSDPSGFNYWQLVKQEIEKL